jgi:hypothetical protein
MIYFAAEAQEEYQALGLPTKTNVAYGYFPARAAAMGAVGPGVVQATFFNFSRPIVDWGIVGAWDIASPEQVIAARYRGADRALRRLWGRLIDEPAVQEAAELARAATGGATPYGRPLYAAHADLPWPAEPHLQLWHAIMLLREFRGDGHVAALVAAGLTGLQAAVTHVAQGDLWSRNALRTTRGYSEEDWRGGVESLVARGWMDSDEQFTEQGRQERAALEDLTDRLALPAWERIGAKGCSRLGELVAPLSQAVLDAGGLRI